MSSTSFRGNSIQGSTLSQTVVSSVKVCVVCPGHDFDQHSVGSFLFRRHDQRGLRFLETESSLVVSGGQSRSAIILMCLPHFRYFVGIWGIWTRAFCRE